MKIFRQSTLPESPKQEQNIDYYTTTSLMIMLNS